MRSRAKLAVTRIPSERSLGTRPADSRCPSACLRAHHPGRPRVGHRHGSPSARGDENVSAGWTPSASMVRCWRPRLTSALNKATASIRKARSLVRAWWGLDVGKARTVIRFSDVHLVHLALCAGRLDGLSHCASFGWPCYAWYEQAQAQTSPCSNDRLSQRWREITSSEAVSPVSREARLRGPLVTHQQNYDHTGERRRAKNST